MDEEVFMNLLRMAVIDRKDFDKPMDLATRVMWHGAALAACLWVMFEEQKQRVYLQGIWRKPKRLTIFPGRWLRARGSFSRPLGARAPIISGHMVNTLRIQSISDHNVSSGQKSDTFKMYCQG